MVPGQSIVPDVVATGTVRVQPVPNEGLTDRIGLADGKAAEGIRAITQSRKRIADRGNSVVEGDVAPAMPLSPVLKPSLFTSLNTTPDTSRTS